MKAVATVYYVIFTFAFVIVAYQATTPTTWERRACDGHESGSELYTICRSEIAERFIKMEYPEVKDLSKMFFTLVSAIFVASLAFWEKILFSAKPDSPAKFSLSAAWVALLLSIISCGVGLALSAIAFDLAAWSPENNFDGFAASSLFWLVLSGCLFVWGLILFTFTSIWAIYHHDDT